MISVCKPSKLFNEKRKAIGTMCFIKLISTFIVPLYIYAASDLINPRLKTG